MSKEDVIEMIKRIPSEKIEFFKIIFENSEHEKASLEFDNDF